MPRMDSSGILAARSPAYNVNKLCDVCQRIVQESSLFYKTNKDVEIQEKHDHYGSLGEIKASAYDGCHLCNLVYGALQSPTAQEQRLQSPGERWPLQLTACYGERLKANIKADMQRGMRDYYCWLQCELRVSLLDPDGSAHHCASLAVCRTKYTAFDRKLYGKKDEDWDILSSANPDPAQLSPFTGSDSCLALGKRWLNDCLASHHMCGGWDSQTPPTRLLDVGAAVAPDGLRLVLGEELGVKTPYLTLSYCWGQTKPVVLTTSLLPAFRASITVSTLPKTIQEAVDITRRLGYRFLWVDSLCIIQDSKEDWKREAARMDQVYFYSTLTIAATVSASNEGGCYRTRNPLSYLPCRIWGTENNGVFVSHSHYARTVAAVQHDSIQKAPLNTRAWVLQERILSRRILHFTGTTLFWDCAALQAFDSCPDGKRVAKSNQLDLNLRWTLRSLLRPPREPRPAGTAYEKLLGRLSRVLAKHDPASEEWERTFQNDWHTVVGLYSNCRLTVSTDKKLALAGIVGWVQRGRDLRYVEGFWFRSGLVPQQLLWATDRTDEPLARPAFRGAPSWSWLSVDGGIVFPLRVPSERDPRREPGATSDWASCCTIVGHSGTAENTTESSDCIDETATALRLEAKVLAIEASGLHQYAFQPDCADSASMPTTAFAVFLVERVSVYARLVIGANGSEQNTTGRFDSKGLAGLILVRRREDNRFMRVGMFQLEPPRPTTVFNPPPQDEQARQFLFGLTRIVDELPLSEIEIF